MILIGISGKKKAGKDTLLTLMKLHTSLTVERIAFADALKLEVAQACKVPVKEIEENKDKYRPILQWWGTDFRRANDSEYWVKQWLQRAIKSSADIVVAPDVRFDNEYAAITKAGGTMVRINREMDVPFDNHQSETSLDKYNFNYVHQNTSMDALRNFARTLLSRVTNDK